MPVIDAETGKELSRGHVPAWSVAVTGTRVKDFRGGAYGITTRDLSQGVLRASTAALVYGGRPDLATGTRDSESLTWLCGDPRGVA